MRRVYQSDAWDSGNYLTRFWEIHETCPVCHGRGRVEKDDWVDGQIAPVEVDCPDCGGDGEVVRYE